MREVPNVILFVCSGNTCRSPLAAALACVHGVDARSAGLNADPGDPAAPEAVRVAKRYGADLSAHEARNVQAKLIGIWCFGTPTSWMFSWATTWKATMKPSEKPE